MLLRCEIKASAKSAAICKARIAAWPVSAGTLQHRRILQWAAMMQDDVSRKVDDVWTRACRVIADLSRYAVQTPRINMTVCEACVSL